jgi:hypothetical protein
MTETAGERLPMLNKKKEELNQIVRYVVDKQPVGMSGQLQLER